MNAAPARTFEEIADQILVFLANAGALDLPDEPTSWEAFERLSALVHDSFEPAPTAMTPMMRRLLFALGGAAKPRRLVGIGTFTGYGFSWLVRSASDDGPIIEYAAGVDVDVQANRAARRNTAALGHGDRLTFIDDDGVAALARSTEPIDLLYLDADDPVRGKDIYVDLIQAALPRLEPGALIVAHDPLVPRFAADFERYHAFVRSSTHLLGPWVLPVDACGVSIASYRGGS